MKTQLSLKNLVPIMMLGLLLIAGTLWAQDSKAFVGDWSGAVFVGEQERYFSPFRSWQSLSQV